MTVVLAPADARKKKARQQLFPDGTPIPAWFADTTATDVSRLGRPYVITSYGVRNDSTVVQTEAIQRVIDQCSAEGGGVIVFPRGTFLSGSLFFKPRTHLMMSEGAVLKGTDAIADYAIVKTRLEGQTLDYFAALVNADGVDGFSISGKGTINGNGRRFWEEFWLRRKVNPKCTNLEALRPRLVYISNSNDVTVSGVRLINPGFWTNHIYRCKRVKYLNCYIYAPTEGLRAPSSDALDLDVVEDVLVHGCYMNVSDDAVCLKGGKGTWVDTIAGNGACRNVIIQHCRYGRAGAGITFGSESFDDRNVILRDCTFDGTSNLILFKMRPDTPQRYTHVLVENCSGMTKKGISVNRWTQFYNRLPREGMPRSFVDSVTLRNVNLTCTQGFYMVNASDQYDVRNVTFENCRISDPVGKMDTSFIQNCKVENVIFKH